MIIADTLANKIVFDIGPGDIGPGQKLVLSFLSGLTMAVVAPPRAAVRKAESNRMMSYIARCIAVNYQKGQTA